MKNLANRAQIINQPDPAMRLRQMAFAGVLTAAFGLSACAPAPEQDLQDTAISDGKVASDAVSAAASDLAQQEAGATATDAESLVQGDDEAVVTTPPLPMTFSTNVAEQEVAGKKLVINVSTSFKVKDVVQTSQVIEHLTQQVGGYIASSNINNYEQDSETFLTYDKAITLSTYYRQGDMTVRVPRDQVSEFLKSLQQQVVFLEHQVISAEDVTLDMYLHQLEAQISAQQATELSAQRSRLNGTGAGGAQTQNANVGAIGATYDARRAEQYAKLQQLDLEDRVKYSTIQLSFTQPVSSMKTVNDNMDALVDAAAPSFADQAYYRFVQGWKVLKSVILLAIEFWWLWLVLLVGLVVLFALKHLWRKIRQRYQRHYQHKIDTIESD